MVDSGYASPSLLADAVLPIRVRLILEHQAKTADSELSRQMQVVLMEAEREYHRESNAHRDPKILASWSLASRLLRERDSALAPTFLRHLHAGLAAIRRTGGSHSKAGTSATMPTTELRLVDTLDIDEEAILAGISARCESRNSLALQLMGYRYGVLAAVPPFDAEHLPLAPTALLHALRASAMETGLPLEARVVLYRIFEKVALPHYPALLETLNTHLADAGILPHLSFIPVRLRLPTDDPLPADAASSSTHSQASAPAATIAVQPGPAAPVPLAPARVAPTEGRFAQLQSRLAQRRKLLAKLRPGEGDDRFRESLPASEVQAALARMRGTHAKPGDLTEIRHTVLAQARQQRGHGVMLADHDADGFELFGLFLTHLQRLLRNGSPGDALIERLRVPLLQLVLRDHGFFVDPQHPARRLLDAVSLAGAAWLGNDDLDPQLLGLLQRAVGTVLEDTDARQDSFVAANHALQAGLQAAARKHEMAERRQIEAARGRERLGLARRQASAEILRITAGRSLPRFNAMLIEHAWADVLALSWLRCGEDSGQWQDLCDATSAIVDAALTPGAPPAPDFVEQLQAALSLVGYHAEEAGMLARALANGRAEEEQDLASKTELLVQLRARARQGEQDDLAPETPTSPRSASQQEAWDLLAGLEDPRWIDMQIAGRESPVRRRLAWVGPRSGQVLLLNRRGMRAEEMTLDQLARSLAAGDIALVDANESPAELAWRATHAGLEHIAGAQETPHGQ